MKQDTDRPDRDWCGPPTAEPFILHPGRVRAGLHRGARPPSRRHRGQHRGQELSLGRLGLLIHTTAGFVDAGFEGYLTLELSNVATLPITLYPGMKIGQISFLRMDGAGRAPLRLRRARAPSTQGRSARRPASTGRTSRPDRASRRRSASPCDATGGGRPGPTARWRPPRSRPRRCRSASTGRTSTESAPDARAASAPPASSTRTTTPTSRTVGLGRTSAAPAPRRWTAASDRRAVGDQRPPTTPSCGDRTAAAEAVSRRGDGLEAGRAEHGAHGRGPRRRARRPRPRPGPPVPLRRGPPFPRLAGGRRQPSLAATASAIGGWATGSAFSIASRMCMARSPTLTSSSSTPWPFTPSSIMM